MATFRVLNNYVWPGPPKLDRERETTYDKPCTGRPSRDNGFYRKTTATLESTEVAASGALVVLVVTMVTWKLQTRDTETALFQCRGGGEDTRGFNLCCFFSFYPLYSMCMGGW